MFSALLLVAALPFETCELSTPGIRQRVKAECSSLQILEDASNATGPRISLRIAVIRAADRDPLPDPIFFLAGGPGQAATESFAAVLPAFAHAGRKRDVVLVDQRGTGGSNRLTCKTEPEPSSDDELLAATTACLGSLSGDPRFYTTSNAVSDLEQVRVALGYGPINLVGVSYGTRVALTYLRRYEANVRTVVLDGVVPSELALGSSHAGHLDRALSLYFGRCAADPGCRRFGDLRTKLRSLMEKAVAQDLVITDPRTGAARSIRFDRPMLASSIRFLAYSPETASLIPLLIDDAHTSGRFEKIAAQSALVEASLRDALALGMELAVLCSEDVPFYDDVSAEGTLLGDHIVRTAALQCSVWPKGPVPKDFHDPVVSNVPALLLSGDNDPVTPPSDARAVARHLSKAQEIILLGQGHNVIARGCAPKLLGKFLDTPSQRVETSCLAMSTPTAFFTSFAGPGP